jgi:histone acetyltransferase (RNA polymerase elongator complex component)
MKKIIPIFLPHQGCTHRCVFCHQPHITGVSLHTTVTPDDVRKGIEIALAEPKSHKKGAQFEVAFYGGTFTGLDLKQQEQFLRIVQPFINRGDLVGIRLSTHPKMFNEHIFALLAAFNVTTVELGVQSFDNLVLKKAARGHTAEEAEQIIDRLQHIGIDVGIHLMIGLPGDSYAGSIRSAQKTISLKPTSVRIHPTLVIRNTQLEVLYRKGQYTPLSLAAAVRTCKDMLKLFRAHQIPVIRIGLQPTASMEQNIVAGPYHPAMRQLVESALAYEEMEALCASQSFPDKQATFYVSPRDISTVRGQKNENLKKLQQQFELTRVDVMPDTNLLRGEMRIVSH